MVPAKKSAEKWLPAIAEEGTITDHNWVYRMSVKKQTPSAPIGVL